MDKKQEESTNRIEELEEKICQMQERLNFVSVLNGKMDESIDTMME